MRFRSGRKHTVAALAMSLAMLGGGRMNAAAATEIWVGGRTHPIQGIAGLVDAPAMFAAGAPWGQVAARTAVVKFGPGDMLLGEDAVLAAAFADLKRRRIALALEVSLLNRTPECQEKSEAYLPRPEMLTHILDKIHRNGGELRYIAMDEPFHFGNRWNGPTACHESAAAIAQRIAVSIRQVRSVFPKVLIGDIEVVDASRPWIDALAGWADAFQAATGEKLAFLHADTDWSPLAMRNLVPLAAAMRGRGVPFGVIYTGDRAADSNAAWTQTALSHLAEIEGPLGLQPDAAIFQTWVAFPDHAMPESEAGTLTNVALRAMQPAPILRFAPAENGRVTGTLTGADGRAMAGATVELRTLGGEGPAVASPRSVTGTVPEQAREVMLAIRAGSEGACICAGPTRVRLGGIGYAEAGSAAPVDDTALQNLELDPNQPISRNPRTLPATPGANFTLTATMAVPPAAAHAGYVAAIFLDAHGKGLGRTILWFEPQGSAPGFVTTDASGRFTWALPAGSSPPVRAFFAGSDTAGPVMVDALAQVRK